MRVMRYAAVKVAQSYQFDGVIKGGGNYAPMVHYGDTVWVSGQIPCVGDMRSGGIGAHQ